MVWFFACSKMQGLRVTGDGCWLFGGGGTGNSRPMIFEPLEAVRHPRVDITIRYKSQGSGMQAEYGQCARKKREGRLSLGGTEFTVAELQCFDINKIHAGARSIQSRVWEFLQDILSRSITERVYASYIPSAICSGFPLFSIKKFSAKFCNPKARL